ncbi:unnamed protein product [Taenia asiatica]|uniref:Secreted protein n=1 Tax=Taenia asiatica TaxID=60517 RepID=A0A0R3VSP6_TAEAS|nr:unnamed protein product [Taenia asiatica]
MSPACGVVRKIHAMQYLLWTLLTSKLPPPFFGHCARLPPSKGHLMTICLKHLAAIGGRARSRRSVLGWSPIYTATANPAAVAAVSVVAARTPHRWQPRTGTQKRPLADHSQPTMPYVRCPRPLRRPGITSVASCAAVSLPCRSA